MGCGLQTCNADTGCRDGGVELWMVTHYYLLTLFILFTSDGGWQWDESD